MNISANTRSLTRNNSMAVKSTVPECPLRRSSGFIKYNRRDMLQVFKTEAEQLDALSRSRTLTTPPFMVSGRQKSSAS